MTEIIITIGVGLVCLLVGLVLGYIWGNRKGESSGFDRGLRAQIKANGAFLNEYRSKFERYQCSRKFFVRSSWDVEDLELASTSQVNMMSESLARLLIDNRVVRPYVVSREPGAMVRSGMSVFHCIALKIRQQMNTILCHSYVYLTKAIFNQLNLNRADFTRKTGTK